MAGRRKTGSALNRRDHIFPQGYLEGFTDDKGKLSVFDVRQRRWFESGPRGVGVARGYYDYAVGTAPDQTADQAFSTLEAQFPNIRRQLVASDFKNWARHLDVLLSYAQMLRARSELFRAQTMVAARQSPMFRVEEVRQEERQTKLRIAPLVTSGPASDVLLRNMSITTMRREISKGPGMFSHLHWCLRSSNEISYPVVTADDALIVQGRAPGIEQAFDDPHTLMFFPLCRQACLIGSPSKFEKDSDAFHAADLKRIQGLYFKSECRFVYAPSRLDVQEER